ncbi:MAG: hypothetical protein DSY80_06150 [Desulfocapsa sp.]|nr:MAG: hypothetical protein DSY80_06150 [Desulfocapsa sp.]
MDRYAELRGWFTGDALDVTIGAGKKKTEKYPVRANPLQSAVAKHTSALFGTGSDIFSGTLVRPKAYSLDTENATRNRDAEHVNDVITATWAQSNGAEIQIRNGMLSQIYGGSVYKLAWVPTDKMLDIPIRIESINPVYFFAIPSPSDYWTLQEAWVIIPIDRERALEYGIPTKQGGYYIEHWTPDWYSVKVNEYPLSVNYGQQDYVMDRPNPWGFVPFVYIPHVRYLNFWGTSLITDAAIGLVKEINLRLADVGDHVSLVSHEIIATKNVQGAITVKHIPGVADYVDLGSAVGFSSGATEPNMWAVKRTPVTDSSIKLVGELYDHLRREIYIPAVADGEDEGSQRSGETLHVRMWPLTGHTRIERALHSTGFARLYKMLLLMLAKKGEAGIKNKHLKIPVGSHWDPILPRGRGDLILELVNRKSANLGTLEHLLSLTGDIDDPAAMARLIMEETQNEQPNDTPLPG